MLFRSVLLNREWESVARILRTSERRAGKRVERGLKKLTRLLRKCGAVVDADTLAQLCSTEGCAQLPPQELAADILASIEATLGRRPSFKLARRTLNTLAWARWRQRFAIGIPSLILFLMTVGGIAWHIDSRTGHSKLISTFLIWSVKREGKTVPGMSQPATAFAFILHKSR